MQSNVFDLIIIGGGPGGYVAAIRASQLGFNVACVEKKNTLGGTCLNEGCIPSKTLLNASHKYSEISNNGLNEIGVKATNVKLDLDQMMANKNEVVTGLTKGIDQLFNKNKITRLSGHAEIKGPGQVQIKSGPDKGIFEAKRIVIATGSKPLSPQGIEIDEKTIISSSGALTLSKVPKRLLVIGAGYIGIEMATVWSRLGAKVEVIDALPNILNGMDGEIISKFKSILKKQGITFTLGSSLKQIKENKSGLMATIFDEKNSKESKIGCDILLVAIGRQPNTENLGIESLGIIKTEMGHIDVDEKFETNIPGIFAIGDVIEGPMLAHKAEEDGVAAVELMAGIAGHVDYGLIPGIVYTYPEIAYVGKTEDQLKTDGHSFKKSVFPFLANSRARATGHTDGLVKLLADSQTDKLLGAHIIGSDAGNLIHEICAAMAFGAAAEDIARTCHGHPTMNEAIKEAALGLGTGAIHI